MYIMPEITNQQIEKEVKELGLRNKDEYFTYFNGFHGFTGMEAVRASRGSKEGATIIDVLERARALSNESGASLNEKLEIEAALNDAFYLASQGVKPTENGS